MNVIDYGIKELRDDDSKLCRRDYKKPHLSRCRLPLRFIFEIFCTAIP